MIQNSHSIPVHPGIEYRKSPNQAHYSHYIPLFLHRFQTFFDCSIKCSLIFQNKSRKRFYSKEKKTLANYCKKYSHYLLLSNQLKLNTKPTNPVKVYFRARKTFSNNYINKHKFESIAFLSNISFRGKMQLNGT